MPVQAQVISPLSLVRVVCSGHMTEPELRAALVEVYGDPDYRPGMPEVADMTTATFVDTAFDEHQLFVEDFNRTHEAAGKPTRVIFVRPEGQALLMIEMFRNLMEAQDSVIPVDVVEGYPEVLALLDLEESDIAHFPEFCQKDPGLL